MFAEIAPTYDFANSVMSLRRHRRWRSQAVSLLGLRAGDDALDICCGTGDFLAPLRRAVGPTGRIIGVDFCLPMLAVAATKTRGHSSLGLGDACRLPIQSEAVDAITVGWGIRNTPNIDLAHAEAYRALRTGGRFVSIDMALPRSAFLRAASRFVAHRLLPLLGSILGKRRAYTYLPKSTETFLSREALADSMRRAGFVDVTWSDRMAGNVCIHFGRKQ